MFLKKKKKKTEPTQAEKLLTENQHLLDMLLSGKESTEIMKEWEVMKK